MRIQHQVRRGFTLVELLVAAALTMLIMAILASSFQTAMDSMSHLRAASEMQERLRASDTRLRSDLMSPHLDDEAIPSGRVSNVRFDRNASILPRAGFFRIDQTDGAAQENLTSALAPRDFSTVARGTENHRLMFTARLSGKSRQSLFTAPRVPGPPGSQGLDGRNDNLVQDALTTYGSRWAIVSWFLAPSGETTKGPNPQPLFNLHRRIKLLAEVRDCTIDPTNPNASHYFHDHRQIVNGAPNPRYGHVFTPSDLEVCQATPVSSQNPPLCTATSNRPADLPLTTNPARPYPVTYYDMYLPVGDGSDIVLSNVTSFEIKADYSQQYVTLPGPITTLYPRPAVDTTQPPVALLLGVSAIASNGFNQDFPFDDLPKNPLLAATATPNLRSFDTGLPGGTNLLTLPTSAPQQYRVKGVQIKIRIYDPKTMGARQVTIIQEM
jgi:hypothetical protein